MPDVFTVFLNKDDDDDDDDDPKFAGVPPSPPPGFSFDSFFLDSLRTLFTCWLVTLADAATPL